MRRLCFQLLVSGLVYWTTLSNCNASGTEAKHIEFNRDIRPIITENCFACHGPDKNQRKAKLRLDLREVALERGAIVPGKPAESKLVDHIFSSDPDDIMPPPKTQKTLTAAQKEMLREWIVQGAEYESHWAYMPLKRPAIPSTQDNRWVRNPIDAFILHTLESKDIHPSREADKATLLRRLSLDLIGLPPTPAELQNFLQDKSPAAYEHQVERLLASPHFGERMAVPWLDVVRFADTVGYHGDQNINIFPYRDYVIDSFNRNKPFDQFTIEQLAGDLLPNPTDEQRVATGFNRLNMVTREGGAQPKEYLAKYAADRVRTVSMAWLGSTMGCAECHDHKYDPFASKDFYQMEAFFADIKQWGVYMDYDYTPNPDLKGFSNDHPFPPEIQVESPYLEQRIASLNAQVQQLCAGAAAQRTADRQASADFQQWRKVGLAFFKDWPTGWATPMPEVALHMKDTNAVAATNFTLETDGWVSFTSEPKQDLKISLPPCSKVLCAIRLEVVPFPDPENKEASPKKWKGSSVSVSARLKSADGTNQTKLTFYQAEADHKKERYANGYSIIGVKDHWDLSREDQKQSAVWILQEPVEVQPGEILEVDLKQLSVASARVSASPFAAREPLDAGGGQPLRNALTKRFRAETKAQHELVDEIYLLSSSTDAETVLKVRKMLDDMRECRHGQAWTLVTEPRDPLITRVLPRGNWQNENGEVVQPLAPHFLPQIKNPDGRRLTRLDLAKWLVSPENPLTSRAVMNRVWKQFFGTGISAIVDDLGAQGEWPVHPELLDWLACEFMHPSSSASIWLGGPGVFPWDLKHMVRLIVLSSTYRQDSNQRPELRDIDPNNRLLACQSPRRLEAEFVRDNALAIAGLLNQDLGGPSVFPYQPAGYYSYLQFPDRDYYPNSDQQQYRRGVYTHWQRTFLHPMLANFDAPAREECTANRVVSDTPQQALTLLNDPTFVEAARSWAARLLQASGSDEERLDSAFKRALARLPKENEKHSLLEFLAVQRDHYGKEPEETKKLMQVGLTAAPAEDKQVEVAAWTQVCRVILNLHETITRY
ncbi:MAG TPA: PSD1 and planctomycete cytochrome C domain-containing protein [Candidatus Limnocylindrales bacterium]|nr:PSD1 and planctomycete cytochrome C domain-containing protein [Candidatus Limnocylindrales bacterium]